MKQHSTEFVGAILLGGSPGALSEVLISQGVGVPPIWGTVVSVLPTPLNIADVVLSNGSSLATDLNLGDTINLSAYDVDGTSYVDFLRLTADNAPSLTVLQPLIWTAGMKQVFTPSGTTAGLNSGTLAGDPSVLVDGDIWTNSSLNVLRARINGVTVSLGVSSGVAIGDSPTWTGIHRFNNKVGIGVAPTYALHVAPTANTTPGLTVFIRDATPVTGATKLVLQSGAANPADGLVFQILSNAGTDVFHIAVGGATAILGDHIVVDSINQRVALYGDGVHLGFDNRAVQWRIGTIIEAIDLAITRSSITYNVLSNFLEINNGVIGTYRDLKLRNLAVNGASIGTSGAGVIAFSLSTEPNNAADTAQLYGKDFAAGDHRVYVRNETGTGSPVAGLGIAQIWTDKQTFTPTATLAGFNWGPLAGDPSAPVNGDTWYNSTSNEFKGYKNGVVVTFTTI